MIWSYKMRKTGLFILSAIFLLASVSFGAKTKYRAFTPTAASKSVFLKTGAKQYKYFTVEKGTSFGFQATGPTKIKIRTRAELKSDAKDGEYEIQIWEGDRLIEGRKAKSKASSTNIGGQPEEIGVARTILIHVPKGRHSYRLWITSEKFDTFYARFYQQVKKAKKTEYSAFKPSEFKKRVSLQTGKSDISYYLVDNSGGVTLSVVGPTRLRIYCRASFDSGMKGNAKFSLGLFEQGKEAGKFTGVAKLSSNMNFKEMGDIIPSRLHTFTFKVPEGKHSYEVKKINSASPNLALRFKIMKDGLGMIP